MSILIPFPKGEIEQIKQYVWFRAAREMVSVMLMVVLAPTYCMKETLKMSYEGSKNNCSTALAYGTLTGTMWLWQNETDIP